MTTPNDIRRLLARIRNSTDIAEARLQHATESLTRRTAIGHPTTASGRDTGPRGVTELMPTEANAHTNLGDLYGYDNAYHPGPSTLLSDIALELRAALTSLNRAHNTLNDCGIPPLITRQYQCTGINGTGCTDWANPDRPDHLCIDCGRAVDSNRRRLRRHRTDRPA